MTQIRIWARLELASSLFTVWREDADDMITEIAQIEIKSGKPGLMSHASRPGNGPKCDIGDPKLISSDGPPEVFQMSSLVGYTAAFSSLGATVRQPYFSVFCTGEHFMTLSNITRRGMIGGLAAGVSAGTIITSDTFISGARAQSARKTFVLIGGAFYGAWCWHRVTDRLEKQGHKVYALTLTGLAERSHLLGKDINLDTHITDIANLVEWEDLTDICLVAHSYAGCPASGALERIGNRVSSIVWVDAIKPADGQAFRDLVPFPIEEGAISRPAPKALPPTAFSDPKDIAWVLSKVTPHPIGTWLQPVKLSGARERVAKKSYIRLPKFQLAALDKAAGECKSDNSWTVLENTTSGHSVMIAEPDWLTDVLVKAA